MLDVHDVPKPGVRSVFALATKRVRRWRVAFSALGLFALLLAPLLADTARSQQAKQRTYLPQIVSGNVPASPPAPTITPSPTPSGPTGEQVIAGAGKFTLLPEYSEAKGEKEELPPEDLSGQPPLKRISCSLQKWGESEVRALEDTIALDVNAGVLYPGALVQGKDLERGIFTPITIPRSGGKLYIENLTFDEGAVYSKQLDLISGSNVKQAVQDILPPTPVGTGARFSEQFEQTYSFEHMMFEFGLDARFKAGSIQANLNIDSEQQRNFIFLKFSQVFYDVIYEDPELSTSVFRDGSRFSDPENQIGAGNPPLYVQKVSYGRQVFLVAESAHSSLDVKAALEGAYANAAADVKVSTGLTYKEIMEKTKIYYTVLGGDAGVALVPINEVEPAKRFEAVRQFIANQDAAVYSSSNPGVPIAYTLRYLADRQVARMSYSITYDRRDCKTELIAPEPPKDHTVEFRLSGLECKWIFGEKCDTYKMYVNGNYVYGGRDENWLYMNYWMQPGVDNVVDIYVDNGPTCGYTKINLQIRDNGAVTQAFNHDEWRHSCDTFFIWRFIVNPSTGKIEQQ